MPNKILTVAAFSIAISIALGAFGAHALKDKVDPYYITVWEKAVFYQIITSIGLLFAAVALHTQLLSENICKKFFVIETTGIFIFSGSLYLLVLTGVKLFGAITPIGGILLITGWLIIGFLK